MSEIPERPVILHFHFFKCAGTSIEHELEHHFGERLARFDRDVPFGKIFAEDLVDFVSANPAVAAITSHQMKMPLPDLPGVRFVPVVFLRHPIDRILSVYRFDRRRGPVTPDATVASEHDLAGYVRVQLDRRKQVENFHVMHLTDAWDPATGRALPIGPSGHLERALAILDQIPGVGVVERYDESLDVLAAVLEPDFKGLRFRRGERNVDPERESTLEARLDALRSGLGDDLYEELLAANSQDFELYEAANRRLDLIRVAHEVGSRDA